MESTPNPEMILTPAWVELWAVAGGILQKVGFELQDLSEYEDYDLLTMVSSEFMSERELDRFIGVLVATELMEILEVGYNS